MAFVPELNQIEAAMACDEYVGWCAECGHEHYNVEPDADGYTCEACGALAVRGAEEWLLTLEE